jgi:hypothetical protein
MGLWERGVPEAEIERKMGLRAAVVRKLGRRSVVEAITLPDLLTSPHYHSIRSHILCDFIASTTQHAPVSTPLAKLHRPMVMLLLHPFSNRFAS